MRVAGGIPEAYYHDNVFASKDHANVSLRPVLRITYEPKGGPGQVFGDAPVGDFPRWAGHVLRRELRAGSDRGPPVATHIAVMNTGRSGRMGQRLGQWRGKRYGDEYLLGPRPPRLSQSLTYYDWKVQVRNQRGEETPWIGPAARSASCRTHRRSPAPPRSARTYETLAEVTFQAPYADPDGPARPSRVQVQVRATTPPGDPIWDSGARLLGQRPDRSTRWSPASPSIIRVLYQGRAPRPGRLLVEDAGRRTSTTRRARGSTATFSLTKGYETRTR